MPSLGSLPTVDRLVKAYIVGDSKDGKTSSLESLVLAGYHLHILDMDNKLRESYLVQKLSRENPKALERIDYLAFRDKYKNLPGEGTVAVRPAKAYDNAVKAMDLWKGSSEEGVRLGTLGGDHVFVLDTLNAFSTAAYNQAQTINPDSKNSMLWYKLAQQSIDNVISGLWSEDFNCNVLVLSHIKDIDLEFTVNSKGEKIATKTMGFPGTIGSALSKEIAKHTNDLYQITLKGYGPTAKRVISTASTSRMNLGTSIPDLPKELPLETGLADIFKHIRGTSPKVSA